MTRRAMRVWGLAPWRRAPVLLLRRPAVALALAAAALVAALPLAAAPLFLSSVEHAALHRQLAATCPAQAGLTVLGPVGVRRFVPQAEELAAQPVSGLAEPDLLGHGAVTVHTRDGRSWPVTLLGRDGYESQVEVLAGPTGAGLWLPDALAGPLAAEVGDSLAVTGAGSAQVDLPVAAIYRDLRRSPDQPYWCGAAEVYRGDGDPDNPPPPVVLTDLQGLLAVAEPTQVRLTQLQVRTITDPELTVPAAARTAGGIDALAVPPPATADSSLGQLLDRAALVRAGVRPPVLPITVAAAVVGLLVAAASALFWGQRRRRELMVLASHGVGARALGLKAVLEALPPVLLGTTAGWVLAWALVAGVGPSPVLAPGTPAVAAVAAAATGLVTLALIGLFAAGVARGLVDARPRRAGRDGARWWRWVPWELALIAAAPVAWRLLATDQVVDPEVGGVGAVTHVPAGLLVAPILALTGIALLVARLAAASLRRRPPGLTAATPARWLARRRYARAAAATAVLAAATAVPVAIATYGATATGSIHTTADAQLRFALGSDTVISYPRGIDRPLGAPAVDPPPAPAALAGHSTEVLRRGQGRLEGVRVDVLAVDPDTYPAGAYWDDRIPLPPLTTVAGQLTAGTTITVVTSAPQVFPGPATLAVGEHLFTVQVADSRPLPGGRNPLVLVHRDLVATGLDDRERDLFVPQLWVTGDPEQTRAAVVAAQLPVSRVDTVEDRRAGPIHEPVAYTFQYLVALSIFTGLVGAVGLLLYLDARITGYRRSYLMLRRLGMAPGAHRRALLLEVAGPVVVGLIAGAGSALAVGFGLRGGFNLAPERFPDTLVELPLGLLAAFTAAIVALVVGAALFTHARVVRADPATVLRDPG